MAVRWGRFADDKQISKLFKSEKKPQKIATVEEIKALFGG